VRRAARAVFPGANAVSAGGTRLLADGAADDLPVPEKVLRSQANVFDDLAKQEGGDVASAVHRNGSSPTVRVPKLLMRSSLPHLFEAHPLQYRDHLSRTEDG